MQTYIKYEIDEIEMISTFSLFRCFFFFPTLPRDFTEVKALLPPEGKSHALRRRDGKRRPLHGTAPAAPEDMPQPAGQAPVARWGGDTYCDI